MLYIVSKTFYQANFKSKAMTTSVCGHNFAVKLQSPELENVAMFINWIDLFCYIVLLINFKMRIRFFYFLI